MQRLMKRWGRVMWKQGLLLSICLVFSGCSTLKLMPENPRELTSNEQLSCEKKAKAKSLQLLEQQYRCTGQK